MKKFVFLCKLDFLNKKKSLVWFIVLCFMLLNGKSIKAHPLEDITVFDKIIANLQQIQIQDADINSVNEHTKNYLKIINEEGSFPDINYADASQTNWIPLDHLNRLTPMVLSYIIPESSYFQDATLYATIVKMLECWYQKNPQSTNWFNREIAWPERMGVILCLMRSGKEKVPVDIENKILSRMKSISKGPNQAGSQGIGANKMDIALQWIYRNCLQKNKTELDFSVSQFYLPLTYNLGQGLQHDYSYLQHGQQLYIGGYGNSVLTAMTKAAFYLEGTEYETIGEKLDLVSGFVRKAYIPAVRGKYMMYNAVGRGFARKNGTLRTGFIPLLEKMIILDPENQTEYEKAIKRISGVENASFEILPSHTHFWRGDYTLHQRPGYTADVRMASVNTCRNENGNGENLKGYFLTDGAMQVAIKGDEYVDIFPVWDWTGIPGITAPAVKTIPQPAQWERTGLSTFAGGVSDSLYGVSVFYLRDYDYSLNTEAKKSYFFFDKEIVCLGSDIKSTNANQINTTLNQCLLEGEVSIVQKNGTTATLPVNSSINYNSLLCVHHNEIAYFFPGSDREDIVVSNKSQSGTWNSISSNSGDAATVRKDVFRLCFNHGLKPVNGSYSYIIVPNLNTVDQAKSYPISDVEILTNTDTIQAVINKKLNLTGAVFYKPSVLEYKGIEIESSVGCAVMIKNIESDKIDIHITDPTRKEKSITLILKNHPILGNKELICEMDNSEAYGGSSHKFVIDKNTLEYLHIPVEGVILDKEEVNLSIKDIFTQLKANIIPGNARVQNVMWTSDNEKVVRVTGKGELIAYGKGEAIITVTTEEGNFQSVCKVVIEDPFKTTEVLADSYVFDGSAGTNYGTATTITVKKDNANFDRRGYFRFSIADLENVNNLENAKIKVVLYTESAAANVSEVSWMLYPVEDISWKENTITWNNKPAAGTNVIAQKKCIRPANSDFNSQYVMEFDVTNYALAEYAKGKKEISFMVTQDTRASGGSGTSNFASKEHEDLRKHPRLIILADQGFTGLEKVSSETLKAYPTVTSGLIYVSLNKLLPVQVFDLNGRLVYNRIPNKIGIEELDLTSFLPGTYLIKVDGICEKIIKH